MTERPRPPRDLPKPPKLRRPPARPYGPIALRQKETFVSGPGDAPTDFIGGQNSETEWVCYWGLAKMFDNPKDPRMPPFTGGYPDWEYQSPQLGLFIRAPGSTVVDFLVHYGGTHVGLRIQTERFHLFTDSQKIASDIRQRAELMRFIDIIDVYDQDLLGDPTGAKAIIALKSALALIEPPNRALTKTAIRGSRLRPPR